LSLHHAQKLWRLLLALHCPLHRLLLWLLLLLL
jgi:hypothetical protein